MGDPNPDRPRSRPVERGPRCQRSGRGAHHRRRGAVLPHRGARCGALPGHDGRRHARSAHPARACRRRDPDAGRPARRRCRGSDTRCSRGRPARPGPVSESRGGRAASRPSVARFGDGAVHRVRRARRRGRAAARWHRRLQRDPATAREPGDRRRRRDRESHPDAGAHADGHIRADAVPDGHTGADAASDAGAHTRRHPRAHAGRDLACDPSSPPLGPRRDPRPARHPRPPRSRRPIPRPPRPRIPRRRRPPNPRPSRHPSPPRPPRPRRRWP